MEVYERRAFYHETDQMGVIHHANYLKWLEEARVRFMDQQGITYRSMEEAGIISPVVSINIEYKSPAKFDDVVIIETTLERYTGSKCEFSYVIKDKETGVVRVKAHSMHCFIKDGTIISLKRSAPDFHKAFEDYVTSNQTL
ncbi:MAG: acyl-CoA thioesterase [Acholeplasmatales bacterium]|nr:acyl-CoA thioesterase [Acholeplasmatales bacterium]